MRRFAASSLFLLVLLSSFVLFSFSSFTSAGGTRFAVYIQEDGTVYGTIVGGTSSIQRDGDVYTFVGNISCPLYVERDNIVIDGAGYTLVGGSGRGVVLVDRHNVTLKNARMELDGGYLIDVKNAVDCTLVGNTLVGTQSLGPIGVNFLYSKNITVKDNTIINSWRGLSLEWSSGHTVTGNTFIDGINGIEIVSTSGCVFRDNSIINSSISIRLYQTYKYWNDLDSSNTIDGKPIYYLVGAKDATVPSNAAYIVLVDCTNMLIENAGPRGIALISTNSSTIRSVTMTGRGDGIDLLNCSGISIIDSVLRDQAIGIQLAGSSGNTIRGNEISNHRTRAINLGDANNNIISGNVFSANSYAIAPSQDAVGTGNILASNNFTENTYAVTAHGNMEIVANRFEGNNRAILLSDSSGSTITQNTFKNNENALYISSSSNNYIYLNNFLNNNHQVTDAGVDNSQASTQPAKTSSSPTRSIQLVTAHVEGVNFFPPPPPSTNYWDNGTKGNYWSDYTGADANGDGVGDTAHYLYEDNQDNYPLMKPVTVFELPASTLVNTMLNDDQIPEGTVGAELPIEYVAAAILVAVAAIAVAGACLFLKRKNNTGDEL